jgi:hypothetical protein
MLTINPINHNLIALAVTIPLANLKPAFSDRSQSLIVKPHASLKL